MKKIVSFIIMFSLVFNILSLPLFAADYDNLSEKDKVLLSIREQLKDQNMMIHYEYYVEIIEQQYASNTNDRLYTLSSSPTMKRVRAANGGAVSYTNYESSFGYNYGVIYFNKEDSEPFREGGISVSSLVGIVSGFGFFVTNPVAATIFGAVGFISALEAIDTGTTQQMIINSPNKCAQMITIESDYGYSMVVTGWGGYPYMDVPLSGGNYYNIEYSVN